MIEVAFNNQDKFRVNKKEVIRTVSLAKKSCKKINGVVEINIINNRLMKKMNKEWRGLDKTTDVLSFAWLEDKKLKSNFLGQIFISFPKIKSQAKEYKVTIKEEFSRMLIHGLLHLVGFDHMTEKDAKKMYSLQEKILKQVYES